MQDTVKIDFVPKPDQVREIYDTLLLPSVNLKRLIGDILVTVNMEVALSIKEFFSKKSDFVKNSTIENEFGQNYFSEENIITYHQFFKDLIKIDALPDNVRSKICGKALNLIYRIIIKSRAKGRSTKNRLYAFPR